MTLQKKIGFFTYDIYTMTDQPETCPDCGARTEFKDFNESYQKHTCPNCKFAYLLLLSEKWSG